MTAPADQHRDRRRTFFGVGAGNAMEWFDWNAYATFSAFFAAQFFAGDDPGAALLKTLAVFAVGFLARPFGGFLFGWIADRKGRKASMSACVALAAAGSLLIGITPTYATIGIAAPAVLLIARLLQGLAHGGELPAAQTYLAEMAPARKRGLWSSVIYVSGSIGVLAATLLAAALTGLLTRAQMAEFGWRIPFLIGGVFGLYALVMRLRMRETATFEQAAAVGTAGAAPAVPLWRQMTAQPLAMVRVVGLVCGFTVVYYVWAISAPAYAISVRGIDPSGALWAGSAATVVFMVALPAWGALSDRFGRRPMLLIALAALVVLFHPLDAMIGTSAWSLFLAMSIALVIIAAGSAIGPALYAELFPTGIRAAGVGVPYSVAVALFGGTAPYLQTLLSEQGSPGLFSGYAIVLMLITGVTVWFLPETKGLDLNTVGATADGSPVTNR